MPKNSIFRDFDRMVENVIAVERGPMQPLVVDALEQLRPMYDNCYFPPYPWITSFTQHLIGHYDITSPNINKWYNENRMTITKDTVIPIIEPMHTFDAFYHIRMDPFLAMAITAEEYDDIKYCFIVFTRDMLGFCAIETKNSTDVLYITAECNEPNAEHLFLVVPKDVWHFKRSMFDMNIDYLADEEGSKRYKRIQKVLDNPDNGCNYSVDDYILIDMGVCDPYPNESPVQYLKVGRDDPDAVMSRVRECMKMKARCILPFHWPIL